MREDLSLGLLDSDISYSKASFAYSFLLVVSFPKDSISLFLRSLDLNLADWNSDFFNFIESDCYLLESYWLKFEIYLYLSDLKDTLDWGLRFGSYISILWLFWLEMLRLTSFLVRLAF